MPQEAVKEAHQSKRADIWQKLKYLGRNEEHKNGKQAGKYEKKTEN